MKGIHLMTDFKHFISSALAVLILVAACSGEARALSYGAGTVTGNGLRLREKPNTSSEVLTTLQAGICVAVLEDARDGWYKVSYQDQTGYLSAGYVEVSTRLDADLGSGRVTTGGSRLNVRSGPGTENGKVMSLPNNTLVKITGIKNGWYKIEHNGRTGYVSSDYLALCSAAQSSNSGGRPAADTTGAIGSGLSTEAGLEVAAYAEKFLGTPYVYGGNGPDSFDCSGFVKYVFAHFGYSINRTASTQLDNGAAVSKDQLQPGDIVFFKNAGDSHAASHVGIYVGGETFIHASSDTREVEYSSLVTSNNAKKYIAARRIVSGE